ncbi:MAG: S8 family serine peptidase, partial [Erysipelotrichaceae bacterium]|nr:S8 family serine peptidase [Erysipelotrichaceae bacterium]
MLVFGNVATAFAETLPDGTKQAGDNAPKTELTVKEIDPDSTGVKKLGDGFEKPADQQPEKLYDDDDIVRVSIRLSKDSVLEAGYPIEDIAYNKKAVSYRKNVAKQQTTVTKKIERKLDIKLDVVWNLTLATNMISANVRYGDIDAIRKIAGVVDVFLENHYEVEKDDSDPDTAITAQYMTYAAYAWAMGYTGAGSKIAIIDTGTNQDHISFDPDALEYSLTRDGKTLDDYDLLTLKDVEELLPQLNANNKETQHNISSAEDAYKNLKIPFAYNYVDGGFITDHDHDNQGEHGSHVSGIAAANYYVKVDGQFVEAIDSVYAVGMAPDAQILTMKVFGENGGASDSDYMAAIEDAIILGADSINLSLGSPNGFSFAEGYQEVMDSLVESGAVVTISAGNNYGFLDFNDLGSTMPYATDNNLNTAGMPGSYINSLSVAAADNVGGVGTPLIFNGARKAYYTQTQNSGADMVTIAGDYKYVYI